MDENKKFRFTGNNLIWIIVLTLFLIVFFSGAFESLVYLILRDLSGDSPAMEFINVFYAPTIGSVIATVIVCWVIKKNRFILRSFLPKGMAKDHPILVIEDTYEPTQENTARNLIIGLALGFLSNFFCIACAMLHGDLIFTSAFTASMIPVLIYAFIMVFIQSTSEEIWCRGFMQERIMIHYPLWVAILANGLAFGFLHMFNDGASVLAIVDITACGISFALLRWYTGSIWAAMGIHAMWNFTQNFIFGLPNSGLVSEVSILRIDAANAVSNWVYSYEFGVEGAVPAVFIDIVIGVVILILAKRSGRLSELKLSYEAIAAQKAQAAGPAANTDIAQAAEPEAPEEATPKN